MIEGNEIQVLLDFMLLTMDEEQLMKIKNTPPDFIYSHHYTVGSWIRKNILSYNSRLYKYFEKLNITDKDNISFFIVKLLHKHIINTYNE